MLNRRYTKDSTEGGPCTVDNKKTHPPCFSTFHFSCIDNRKEEVSTELWYSMIGRLATPWLSSSSGVARACAHAHIIFTAAAVSKRDTLS